MTPGLAAICELVAGGASRYPHGDYVVPDSLGGRCPEHAYRELCLSSG